MTDGLYWLKRTKAFLRSKKKERTGKMDTDKLYRVQKQDLPKLEDLLNHSFANDPLYRTLIPNEAVRKRLMPELFHSDLDEFFETCQIFADSPELKAVLVVEDEAHPRGFFRMMHASLRALLMTDTSLIREDPSLKTFENFLKGEDYLNSAWTQALHVRQRLHIIYLAVDPRAQHQGLADRLMETLVAYAEAHHMMLSLETHNERNLSFYHRYAFEVCEIVQKHFALKQYCLIRRPASGLLEEQTASGEAAGLLE